MSFLFREVKIQRKAEIIFLIVILIEVMFLAFIMANIKEELNRNFSIIIEKLGK